LLAWLLLKVLIKLEYMLAGPLVFALAGCMGLFAALQMETYAALFLGGLSVQGALRQVQCASIDRLEKNLSALLPS
jgi:hypothetical protein